MHLESTRDRLQLMEQLKSDISSSAELTKSVAFVGLWCSVSKLVNQIVIESPNVQDFLA